MINDKYPHFLTFHITEWSNNNIHQGENGMNIRLLSIKDYYFDIPNKKSLQQ